MSEKNNRKIIIKIILIYVINITVIYIPLFTLGQSSTKASYKTWEQIGSSDDIVSYVGTIKVKNLIPTKVKMTIDATPEAVIKAVTNSEKYKLWIPYCTDSRILKKVNQNEFYTYYYISPPIVSDRDVVVHIKVIKTGEKSYEIILQNTNNYKKEEIKGVVRIPHLLSHYWIYVDNKGITNIIHINETALGGNIPMSLISWANKKQPLETMKTLKDCILKKKI